MFVHLNVSFSSTTDLMAKLEKHKNKEGCSSDEEGGGDKEEGETDSE